MTKVYKINGKEIEKLEQHRFVDGVKTLARQVDLLLEALDEKKEEKYCDHGWYANPAENKRWCYHCDTIEKIKKEEPKSTLKEEVRIIIHDDIRLTTHEQADKIISLFKDTLLKEIEKVRNNYVMYEIEPYEKDIINLIKNL